MSASLDAKLSISVRDLTLFNDLGQFQKFIEDEVQAKLVESAAGLYNTTTCAAGTFHIQPLRTRCVGDFGPTYRVVEISVNVSGRF